MSIFATFNNVIFLKQFSLNYFFHKTFLQNFSKRKKEGYFLSINLLKKNNEYHDSQFLYRTKKD